MTGQSAAGQRSEVTQRSRATASARRGGLAAGLLGTALLAWLAICFVAPGFGSVVAVFGSPVLAFFVILALLTLNPESKGSNRGSRAAVDGSARFGGEVAVPEDGVCHDCGARVQLMLRPILPIGRAPLALERRFVVLCSRCNAARDDPARGDSASVRSPLHPIDGTKRAGCTSHPHSPTEAAG